MYGKKNTLSQNHKARENEPGRKLQRYTNEKCDEDILPDNNMEMFPKIIAKHERAIFSITCF